LEVEIVKCCQEQELWDSYTGGAVQLFKTVWKTFIKLSMYLLYIPEISLLIFKRNKKKKNKNVRP
jgi:hypothetical protein